MNPNDETNNDTKGYEHQQCDSNFPSTSNENNRDIRIEIRPHICDECGKGFKHKRNLQRHELIHKNEKPYQCKLCEDKFRRKETLNQHVLTKHINDDRYKDNMDQYNVGVSYKCGTCNKGFKSKSQLIVHERTHNGEKPYECKHCGFRFSQKGNLSKHVIAKHNNDGRCKDSKDKYDVSVPHKCGTCNKEFKDKWHLRRHEKIHNGEKTFECEYCEKIFLQKGNLSKHVIAKHNNDGCCKDSKDKYDVSVPHKCGTCNKEFKDKWHLRRHEKIHNGEKTFECEYCGKIFSQKGNLSKHVIAKHNNDGCCKDSKDKYDVISVPHKCGTCNKEFKRKSQLIVHERTHKYEQHYLCEICGEMFRWVLH
ncbi:PREDICTED: zinc finger protein OZF-like [Cyphomyrmex costatus]|uniref:zinc finger protein OZF-like n=1 Tax=Cyphomyrmex costatus TaxID=456900 RepID=UPI0008522059|nr:PREDICTED: zinc finger protein OZF-like [Cyphomyrmex costatus]